MKHLGRLYDIISGKWFTEDPTRISWFLRLLDAMDDNGVAEMSRAKYGRLFNCTAKAAYYFLSCLDKQGVLSLHSDTNSTKVTLSSIEEYSTAGRNLGADWAQESNCSSSDYDTGGRNLGAIKAQDSDRGRDLGAIRAREKDCISDTSGTAGRNLGADWAQNGRKENRKESPLSPTPPITKEKNKEKKPLTRSYAPDFIGDVSSTHAKEIEKQKRAEERKKKSEERKTKELTLVHKAREVFEKYYQEIYEDSYYWEAKDAVAMKRLLKKITFGRTNRPKPLPCDDDSLLQALDVFLRMINKSWLMNNFSVCKIDSQYNEIVSEIKNKNKPTPNGQRFTTSKETSTAILAGQAENIINDIAKADELYYRGE